MSLSSFLTSAKNEELCSSNYRTDIVFMERFGRCNSLLHFLAYRILGTHEGAGNAVENCRIVASRNPPDFAYEGAFRSRVARILIDEGREHREQRLPEKRAFAQPRSWPRSRFVHGRMDALADRAQIDLTELIEIERNLHYTPEPRTVYQSAKGRSSQLVI